MTPLLHSATVQRMRIMMLFVLALGCSSKTHAPGADAPTGATFACSTATCSSSQFCYDYEAGREQPAAVSSAPAAMPGCNALPQNCDTNPTCACVMAGTTFSCPVEAMSCSAHGDAVTVYCALP